MERALSTRSCTGQSTSLRYPPRIPMSYTARRRAEHPLVGGMSSTQARCRLQLGQQNLVVRLAGVVENVSSDRDAIAAGS